MSKISDQKRLEIIKKRVSIAPVCSGCYLWKDSKGLILYIGKAVNLRSRLKNYVQINLDSIKTSLLMKRACDVEWIQTENEVEALLLESNLVTKHKPRFNIRLKDDKTFPYICLSLGEMFPRVFLTRDTKDKTARYFGPFTDVRAARTTLNLIHKIFPIRKVRQTLPLKKNKRPCVNFHIKRCLGPCQGNVKESDYKLIVDQILLFLEGKREVLEEIIQEKMQILSKEENFEHAALYRDMLYEIHKTKQLQYIHSLSGNDEDIVAVSVREGNGHIVLLEFRSGRMIARKSFPIMGIENAKLSDVFISFLRDHYLNEQNLPAKIILEEGLPTHDKKILEKAFLLKYQKGVSSNGLFETKTFLEDSLRASLDGSISDKSGVAQKTTTIIKGRSEHHRSVLRLAKKNAELLLSESLITSKIRNREEALLDLQKMLQLKEEPRVIECYDISHLQGKYTVASGVVFLDGAPHPSSYRHYNIKSVVGIDDPASIREAVARRIQRLLNEEKALPDLILIDGGLTQLSAACEAVVALGQGALPIVSIAKKHEEIYIPGEATPSRFDQSRPGMRLLLSLRDEAHRFAITFHRQKRNKETLKSAIQKIPDIGSSRKKALLSYFTEKNLSDVTLKELQQVPGIGSKLANRIFDYFSNPKNSN